MSELIDAISAGFELPGDDCRWGFRVCREGGHSSRDFVWPSSGPVAAPGPFDEASDDPCPSWSGDGICLATAWSGVTSGGLPAEVFLLAAYQAGDVLGADIVKVRVRAATVVASWSAAEFVRRLLPVQGTLDWAYLRGADLRGVDLRGAWLRGARLSYADLSRANLRDARLPRAYLTGTNLTNADLTGADLRQADLPHANLTGANLTDANLAAANLSCANLLAANPAEANLRGAVLSGAVI